SRRSGPARWSTTSPPPTGRAPATGRWRWTLFRLVVAAALGLAALYPAVDRWRAQANVDDVRDIRSSDDVFALIDAGTLTRVERPMSMSMSRSESRSAPELASWQTVGGCGAGASSGTGAGVKWVGRNVSGGLFHVECQANYVKTTYGYNYVGTTLV